MRSRALRSTSKLLGLTFALAFGLALTAGALPGCVVHENSHETVVDKDPPPDREEAPQGASPSTEHVWIKGHYRWEHGEYDWVPGHWERRPRPAAEWVHGHWARRGGGWVWVEGHWTLSNERRVRRSAREVAGGPAFSRETRWPPGLRPWAWGERAAPSTGRGGRVAPRGSRQRLGP